MSAWTQSEIKLLEDGYMHGLSIKEIQEKLPNRSAASITHKAIRLGYSTLYMKKQNSNFKAPYQDYVWCYDRYIIKGLTHKEMADELNVSLRVIQKWCVEKHGLHQWSFARLKRLNSVQKELIIAGTLGDGHIDKRDDCPIYIESHSETETDYIFWKYSILKDICNSPPIFHNSMYCNFGTEKKYYCKSFHRLATRKVNELLEIKNMSKMEKIDSVTEFGFSIHILDDGHRNSSWILCLAEWSDDEILYYIRVIKEKFGLNCYQEKDKRYIRFDADSSRKIDNIILRNIPNELDIIRKKITNNIQITSYVKYRYVITSNGKTALGKYSKLNHLNYRICRSIFDEFLETEEIMEENLLEIYKEVIEDTI